MKLVQPYISNAKTMRLVCTSDRTGKCRYSDALLAKLPEWIEDPRNERMTRGAQLVGFNKSRAVWLYGFRAGSQDAKAHRCDTGVEAFLFVLAHHNGNILDMKNGFALDLPEKFRRVIDGGW